MKIESLREVKNNLSKVIEALPKTGPVVVTKNGCQVITNFPSDRLISCGLPGCDVF